MKKITFLLIFLLVFTPCIKTVHAESSSNNGTDTILLFGGIVLAFGLFTYLYGYEKSKEISPEEAAYIREQTNKRYIDDFLNSWKGKNFDDVLLIYKTPSKITDGEKIKIVSYQTCDEIQYTTFRNNSLSFFNSNSEATYSPLVSDFNVQSNGTLTALEYGSYFSQAIKVGESLDFIIDKKTNKVIDATISKCTFN